MATFAFILPSHDRISVVIMCERGIKDDNDDNFFMLLGRSFHKFEPETVKLRW